MIYLVICRQILLDNFNYVLDSVNDTDHNDKVQAVLENCFPWTPVTLSE